MENIETLRKHTKIKLLVMSLSTLLPIIILTAFPFIPFPDKGVSSELMPYRYVIAAITEGWIAFKLAVYIKILKNDEYAEAVQIKKNDERNKFIRLRSNNLVVKICLYVFLVCCVIAAFIDKIVFYTLLAVLGVMLLVYGIVKLYFIKKY